MLEYFRLTLQKYNEFQGGGAQMTLFWVSALLLLVLPKFRGSKIIGSLLKYTLLFLIVFFCPISAGIIMKYCIGESVYWRMLWLLPEVIVIAYFLTNLVMEHTGAKRVVLLILCGALVATTGTGFFKYLKPTRVGGINKLPNETIALCESLQAEKAKRGESEIRVIVPDELVCSVRQYDATIKMPYGRAVLKGEKTHLIHDTLTQAPVSFDLLAYQAGLYGCNYLVYPISEDGSNEAGLQEAGFESAGQVAGYGLYHIDTEKKDEWAVISYPDQSGNQAMFYTLYNAKKDSLIVVDGGWNANTDLVRRVIKAHGDKVKAWILTHYHTDHISAFNEIYQNPKGIKIQQVYVSPYDRQYFEQVAEEWDNLDTYENFLNVTKNGKNISALHRDDTLEIDGLKLQVFNSYDQLAVENTKDIGNDGGLMFKVTGKNASMLFCADVHSKTMADMLLERYGDELKADYVQLGHHGNNSFPTYLYDVVDARVAIFDMPESIMNGEKYTCQELKSYLIKKGTETREYSQGASVLYL